VRSGKLGQFPVMACLMSSNDSGGVPADDWRVRSGKLGQFPVMACIMSSDDSGGLLCAGQAGRVVNGESPLR
jgi:hypothetical protein